MEEPKIPIKIVMPQSVKRWIAIQAAMNMRSQTSEIVLAIKEKMERVRSAGAGSEKGDGTTLEG